jgi:hypothetical protein
MQTLLTEERPLTAKLRQIRSLLNSPASSALPPSVLRQALELFQSWPIEVAEMRASPKQLAFQAAFLSRRDELGRKRDIFVALGGNRSGKTIVSGVMCFAKFLRDCALNGDAFWCVAPNFEKSVGAAGGQQKDLWNALPRWMFGNQRWDEKNGFTHRKVVLPTRDGGQCVVEFRSSDQDGSTFESGKLRGVWADERLPEPIYNRLLARIIDRDGFLLYSDIPEQWWQLERLVHAEAGAGIYVTGFEMADNRHNLPPGTIEQAAARMTEDEARMRIKGLFVIMEGLVYREYVPARHDIAPFPIPRRWPKWRIIDYGASAPTACAWITIAPNQNAYLYREYYERNRTVPANAQMIIAMSVDEEYVSTLIDPHAKDPPPVFYGVAKPISVQYADAGIPTVGWPYMQGIEHACVGTVRARFERDQFFIFNTCVNAKRELGTHRYKCDQDGKPIAADAYENKNNHLLDDFKGFFATNPAFEQVGIRVAGGE